MRVVVTIGVFCVIFFGLLGMVGYSFYRIAELEKVVSEEQQIITNLSLSWGPRVDARLNGLEEVTQPLLNGTPIMMCKPGLLSDQTCTRVTFVKR